MLHVRKASLHILFTSCVKNTSCNKFRGFHYPRKFFNNEIFPDYGISFLKAGINGPADPVLAEPVCLKVKINSIFTQKQIINEGANVIFGLVRLTVLNHSR